LASFKEDVSHQRVELRTAQPFFADLRAGAYRVFMSPAARGKLRISFRPCGSTRGCYLAKGFHADIVPLDEWEARCIARDACHSFADRLGILERAYGQAPSRMGDQLA
jgi:hypothetical protein